MERSYEKNQTAPTLSQSQYPRVNTFLKDFSCLCALLHTTSFFVLSPHQLIYWNCADFTSFTQIQFNIVREVRPVAKVAYRSFLKPSQQRKLQRESSRCMYRQGKNCETTPYSYKTSLQGLRWQLANLRWSETHWRSPNCISSSCRRKWLYLTKDHTPTARCGVSSSCRFGETTPSRCLLLLRHTVLIFSITTIKVTCRSRDRISILPAQFLPWRDLFFRHDVVFALIRRISSTFHVRLFLVVRSFPLLTRAFLVLGLTIFVRSNWFGGSFYPFWAQFWWLHQI